MYKGTESFVDHYSCFFDTQRKVQGSELVLLNLCQNNIFLKNPTKLESLMLKNDIIDVYICGLALDICVGDLIILVSSSFSRFELNPAHLQWARLYLFQMTNVFVLNCKLYLSQIAKCIF